MKTLVVAATAVAILSGAALTSASASAASIGRHSGLTAHERAAVAQSRRDLNALKWRVRADGHVSAWERARVRMAQARHDALVYRYTHN